jgi:hypothetical protein
MNDDEFRERALAIMQDGTPSTGDNLLGMEIDFDVRLGDLPAVDSDSVKVGTTGHAERLLDAACTVADGFTLDAAMEAISTVWLGDLRYPYIEVHHWSPGPTAARMRFITQMGPKRMYVTGDVTVTPPRRAGLPDGWTLRRVREQANGPAELLSLGTLVTMDIHNGEPQHIRPTSIISFSGLCLVRDQADGVWCMGQVDDEGVIRCWAGYGEDLGDAIRGL